MCVEEPYQLYPHVKTAGPTNLPTAHFFYSNLVKYDWGVWVDTHDIVSENISRQMVKLLESLSKLTAFIVLPLMQSNILIFNSTLN